VRIPAKEKKEAAAEEEKAPPKPRVRRKKPAAAEKPPKATKAPKTKEAPRPEGGRVHVYSLDGDVVKSVDLPPIFQVTSDSTSSVGPSPRRRRTDVSRTAPPSGRESDTPSAGRARDTECPECRGFAAR